MAFVVPLVCLAADGPAGERASWEQRIQQVHIGMRRAEVEKFLPQYVAPPTKTSDIIPYSEVLGTITGGSQTVAYYVSPGWRVCVPYDYTGIPRDAAGNATGDLNSPDNRVVGAITLEYLLKPANKAAPKKR
jgi:hypothetical protein